MGLDFLLWLIEVDCRVADLNLVTLYVLLRDVLLLFRCRGGYFDVFGLYCLVD